MSAGPRPLDGNQHTCFRVPTPPVTHMHTYWFLGVLNLLAQGGSSVGMVISTAGNVAGWRPLPNPWLWLPTEGRPRGARAEPANARSLGDLWGFRCHSEGEERPARTRLRRKPHQGRYPPAMSC